MFLTIQFCCYHFYFVASTFSLLLLLVFCCYFVANINNLLLLLEISYYIFYVLVISPNFPFFFTRTLLFFLHFPSLSSLATICCSWQPTFPLQLFPQPIISFILLPFAAILCDLRVLMPFLICCYFSVLFIVICKQEQVLIRNNRIIFKKICTKSTLFNCSLPLRPPPPPPPQSFQSRDNPFNRINQKTATIRTTTRTRHRITKQINY